MMVPPVVFSSGMVNHKALGPGLVFVTVFW